LLLRWQLPASIVAVSGLIGISLDVKHAGNGALFVFPSFFGTLWYVAARVSGSRTHPVIAALKGVVAIAAVLSASALATLDEPYLLYISAYGWISPLVLGDSRVRALAAFLLVFAVLDLIDWRLRRFAHPLPGVAE
jgi:hypothetical protein